jgi:hypothetical protein
VIVYHRTTHDVAKMILASGFEDATGTYLTEREWSGVWFSDRPIGVNEGTRGDELLALQIPREIFMEFEWIEDEKGYREALIPAEIVNRFGPAQPIEES